MKPKPLTHIEKERIRLEQVRSQICDLLGWTESEYVKFQNKTGCSYLQAYISRVPNVIDLLIASALYWKWFRNSWVIRDEVLSMLI